MTTVVTERVPQMTYPEAMRQFLHAKFRRWYNRYNDGLSDEDLLKQGFEVDENEVAQAVSTLDSEIDDLAARRETVPHERRSEFDL